jgi:hypothetical protein
VRRVVAALVVVAAAVAGGYWLWLEVLRDDTVDPTVTDVDVTIIEAGTLRLPDPTPRSTDVYEGHGAWVDAFDYSPNYTDPDPPHLTPAVVDDMADDGVRTLYLQATRLDERTPGVLEDPWLLAEFLLRAHQRDVRVVGWYLPEWVDDGSDLTRVRAALDFEVLGHRFDGFALDIEYINDGLEPDERSRRLVALSQQITDAAAGDPVAAIVPPPVQTEVINPQFWPGFPWRDIEPHYDVWMPMSYWSFRTTSSGYKNGYSYNEESIRRLRTNLGRPAAAVHAIGGIGAVDGIDDDPNPEEPLASIGDLAPFVQSLRDTGAIGGSIYDWRTMEPAARDLFADLMRDFDAG